MLKEDNKTFIFNIILEYLNCLINIDSNIAVSYKKLNCLNFNGFQGLTEVLVMQEYIMKGYKNIMERIASYEEIEKRGVI